jgi:hypothetical protein
MIKARNQDDHELLLSTHTHTQEQHDENHGGRS